MNTRAFHMKYPIVAGIAAVVALVAGLAAADDRPVATGIPAVDQVSSVLRLADQYGLKLILFSDGPEYSLLPTSASSPAQSFVFNERDPVAGNVGRYFSGTALQYALATNGLLWVWPPRMQSAYDLFRTNCIGLLDIHGKPNRHEAAEAVASALAGQNGELAAQGIVATIGDWYGRPDGGAESVDIPASLLGADQAECLPMAEALPRLMQALDCPTIFVQVSRNEPGLAWKIRFCPAIAPLPTASALSAALLLQDKYFRSFSDDRTYIDQIEYPLAYWAEFRQFELLEMLQSNQVLAVHSQMPDVKFAVWSSLRRYPTTNGTDFLLSSVAVMPSNHKWRVVSNLLPPVDSFGGLFSNRIRWIQQEYTNALLEHFKRIGANPSPANQ